jgi:phage baseplate assembly protein V
MGEQLKLMVRMMLSRGEVTLVDDGGGTQRLQLALLDGELKGGVEKFEPYGFTSVPLIGAEVLAAFLGGNRSHGIAVVAHSGPHRPRRGGEGDVTLYHHTDDPMALAENAKHRITLVPGRLVIRVGEIDIKCGKSRLVMNDEGVILTTPDFQAVKA